VNFLRPPYNQDEKSTSFNVGQDRSKDSRKAQSQITFEKVTQHVLDLAFPQSTAAFIVDIQESQKQRPHKLPQKAAAFVTACLLAVMGPTALNNRSASAEGTKTSTITSEDYAHIYSVYYDMTIAEIEAAIAEMEKDIEWIKSQNKPIDQQSPILENEIAIAKEALRIKEISVSISSGMPVTELQEVIENIETELALAKSNKESNWYIEELETILAAAQKEEEMSALSLTEIGEKIQTLQQEIVFLEEEISTEPDNQELQNQLLSLTEELNLFLAQAVTKLISSLGAEKTIVSHYSRITLAQAKNTLENIIPSSTRGAIAAGNNDNIKRDREALIEYSKIILSLIFPREKPSPKDWQYSDLDESWKKDITPEIFEIYKESILNPENYSSAISGSIQYEIWNDQTLEWTWHGSDVPSISVYLQEIMRLEKIINETDLTKAFVQPIFELYSSLAYSHWNIVWYAERLLASSSSYKNFLPDLGGKEVLDEKIMAVLRNLMTKIDKNQEAGLLQAKEMIATCEEWSTKYLEALTAAGIVIPENVDYIVPNYDFFSSQN
jgi:hypothetical protein